MVRAVKRILWISCLSAVVPLVFVVGWRLNVEALFAWPAWLFYIWPTALMLSPWQSGGLDFWFFVALLISLGVNAMVWSVVGLVLIWLLIDLPAWAHARKKIDV